MVKSNIIFILTLFFLFSHGSQHLEAMNSSLADQPHEKSRVLMSPSQKTRKKRYALPSRYLSNDENYWNAKSLYKEDKPVPALLALKQGWRKVSLEDRIPYIVMFHKLGVDFFSQGQNEEAMQAFRIPALNRFHESQFLMGLIFVMGCGSQKPDLIRASGCFYYAMKNGSEKAKGWFAETCFLISEKFRKLGDNKGRRVWLSRGAKTGTKISVDRLKVLNAERKWSFQ